MDIYGGQDPRHIPNYSIGEAARYLNIPNSTIRAWTAGRKYPVVDGHKTFRPLIETQGEKPLRLTFINLIEIHILRAIRQHHKINLAKVRSALDYLDKQFKIPHPLAHQEFLTDGVDLFKDARIARNSVERKAVAYAKIRMFTLASKKLTGEQTALAFRDALASMLRFIDKNPAPFIARVYKDGKVSAWRDYRDLLEEIAPNS